MLTDTVNVKMATLPAGAVVLESLRACSERAGINRLSVIGRTTVLPANKSMSNIRSDTEDAGPDVVAQSLDASVLGRRNDRTIHSGHFMLSHVHDDSSPAESSRGDVINDESDDEVTAGCDTVDTLFQSAFRPSPGLKTTSSHLAIDTSLTKLFECMTLAYRLLTLSYFTGCLFGDIDKILYGIKRKIQDGCHVTPYRLHRPHRPQIQRYLTLNKQQK